MTLEFLKICFKSLKNLHRHASVRKVFSKSADIGILMKGCLIVLLGRNSDVSLFFLCHRVLVLA